MWVSKTVDKYYSVFLFTLCRTYNEFFADRELNGRQWLEADEFLLDHLWVGQVALGALPPLQQCSQLAEISAK